MKFIQFSRNFNQFNYRGKKDIMTPTAEIICSYAVAKKKTNSQETSSVKTAADKNMSMFTY